MNYLVDVTAKELSAARISGDGDEGWDAEVVSLTRDEVLNMQGRYDQDSVLVDFLAEQQRKKLEEAMAESRRKQYEELQKEFGSAGA